MLGIPQQVQQVGHLGRLHCRQDRVPLVHGQVTQGIHSLVGLHVTQQLGRPRWFGLAQQRRELLGVHFLECVGRLFGGQRVEQPLAIGPHEVLEQVRQLAGPQPFESFVGGAQAHLGCRAPFGVAERLDRAPVDDPFGGGAVPPTRRSQPPEQRLGRNIHSHQAVAPIERCQIEVGGPDDLDSVDVHQLVVEDLFEEGHLA